MPKYFIRILSLIAIFTFIYKLIPSKPYLCPNNVMENEQIIAKDYDDFIRPDTWNHLPVKGAFYMFVSNDQLGQVRETMKSVQLRYNLTYPWIFLNSQPFSPIFKKYVTKLATNNNNSVYFGQIDLKAWTYPYWIDVERTETSMQQLALLGTKNAQSLYFRQKMRYNAGLFYHHSLFNQVEYVWHLEPGTIFHCDMLQSDPFHEMKTNNKKIAFTLTQKEEPDTIFSLWPASLQYIKQNNITSLDHGLMPWIITENNNYNFCYFSSHFEILSLDFLKSDQYQSYFNYLDHVGGFFYERWADGPVKTLAIAMFLNRNDIHFMNEVGVEAENNQHCPLNHRVLSNQCSCDFKNNHNILKHSCTIELLKHIDINAIGDIISFSNNQV